MGGRGVMVVGKVVRRCIYNSVLYCTELERVINTYTVQTARR